MLKNNELFWVKTVGDHWQFKHPTIRAKVTISSSRKGRSYTYPKGYREEIGAQILAPLLLNIRIKNASWYINFR